MFVSNVQLAEMVIWRPLVAKALSNVTVPYTAIIIGGLIITPAVSIVHAPRPSNINWYVFIVRFPLNIVSDPNIEQLSAPNDHVIVETLNVMLYPNLAISASIVREPDDSPELTSITISSCGKGI